MTKFTKNYKSCISWDTSLAREAKARAALRGISCSQLVSEATKQYLSKINKKTTT